MESIVWQGKECQLLPSTFYHLAHQDSHLFWNVFLSKGFLISDSVTALTEGLQDVTTPYAFSRQDDPKEKLWERIRESEYPQKPSRKKAFFLFDEQDTALHAKETWFPGEERRILNVRVLCGSMLHRGDSRWLDSFVNEWEENARKYWAGEMTKDPTPEVILHGVAFFPDWEEPPFGSLLGKSINPKSKGAESDTSGHDDLNL